MTNIRLTKKEKHAVRMAISATLRMKASVPGWYYTATLQGIKSMVYTLRTATWMERNDARHRKIERIIARCSGSRRSGHRRIG